MCKKLSSFDEIEKLFTDYFRADLYSVKVSRCTLCLEVPLFPSIFTHLFAPSIFISIQPKFYSPGNVRLLVTFYTA